MSQSSQSFWQSWPFARFAAGIIGYFLQGLGMEYYATGIPKQIRHRFYADLWAHNMSYLSGILGGIVLCIAIWRKRGQLAAWKLAAA